MGKYPDSVRMRPRRECPRKGGGRPSKDDVHPSQPDFTSSSSSTDSGNKRPESGERQKPHGEGKRGKRRDDINQGKGAKARTKPKPGYWLSHHLLDLALKYLPLKSLCRLRCVSTEWNSSIVKVITNGSWIIRSGKNKSVDIRDSKVPINMNAGKWTRVPMKMPFDSTSWEHHIITCASSNGLCLIRMKDKPLAAVYNPMTQCCSRILHIDFSLDDTFVALQAHDAAGGTNADFRLVVVKMIGASGEKVKDYGRINVYDSTLDEWIEGSGLGLADPYNNINYVDGISEELMLGCAVVDSKLYFLSRAHDVGVILQSVPLLSDTDDGRETIGAWGSNAVPGADLLSTEFVLGHCAGKFVLIIRMPSRARYGDLHIMILKGNEWNPVDTLQVPRMEKCRMHVTCRDDEIITLRLDSHWGLMYNLRTKKCTFAPRNTAAFFRYFPSFLPLRETPS